MTFFNFNNYALRKSFEHGTISKEESNFLLKLVHEKFQLEHKFISASINIIKENKTNITITNLLDSEFLRIAKDYFNKNSDSSSIAKRFKNMNEGLKVRTITGWRVATMSRLAEINVFSWTINSRGQSQYTLR